MKKTILMLALLGVCGIASAQPFGFGNFNAQENQVDSPDGRLSVSVKLVRGGAPVYTVSYDTNTILENSPLGLVTTSGDFTRGLEFVSAETESVSKSYTQEKIKKSHIDYNANKLTYVLKDSKGQEMSVIFEVSNNDIAFRYLMKRIPGGYENDSIYCAVIKDDQTHFNMPAGTKTFLSPQMKGNTGWSRTAPSYELPYYADDDMGKNFDGAGFIFPCLFKTDGKTAVADILFIKNKVRLLQGAA